MATREAKWFGHLPGRLHLGIYPRMFPVTNPGLENEVFAFHLFPLLGTVFIPFLSIGSGIINLQWRCGEMAFN